MFGSALLEVAIGLIFVYLILSLLSSAIAEGIESILKRRSSDLKQGITELLSEEGGGELTSKLYKHPLILSLYQGNYNLSKTRNLPSYIPSRNFALAVMDIVRPATESLPSGAANALAGLPSIAPPSNQPGAVAPTTAPAVPGTLEWLRQGISTLGNPNLERALRMLIDAAGDNVNQARQNIEDWFDSGMDRVSGWYKRRVQVILVVIGLVIAIAINADTITIGDTLSHDPALRESLVNAAQEYAKADPAADQGTTGNSASDIAACREDETSPACRIGMNLKEIEKLGLPIGWDPEDPRTIPGGARDWALKVIGWLLTAAAVSLGAPFWFDLLNKFIIIRSTVRPREKSPEERPIG
jgi:hypothetical protein